jgi:small subunit ribosomal protein S15
LISKAAKASAVAAHQAHGTDTGTPEVQVAILTERINGLYLRRNGPDRYQALIKSLGLRR